MPWTDFPFGERSFIMGIVNVTPDSFSGDGLVATGEATVTRMRQLATEGADILDIGAESTRPGAEAISEDEEHARLAPLFTALANDPALATSLPPLSIDTTKPAIARAALAAGFRLINDVNGLLGDRRTATAMAETAAEARAGLIVMHNGRIAPITGDVISSITGWLDQSIAIATTAGLAPEALVLDPGIGFGKTREQDIEILRRLDEFHDLGRPLLIGASRKRVIAHVLDLPIDERLEGTLAVTVAGVVQGADIFRVHDVAANVRAARMADAIFR